MKQTSRSALIEQMRTARLKQFAKLIFRATYIGRNPQTSQSMLEAVIHRRGNRRDFSYSRYPGNTSVVHFAERWVASWEVWSGSSYPPVPHRAGDAAATDARTRAGVGGSQWVMHLRLIFA